MTKLNDLLFQHRDDFAPVLTNLVNADQICTLDLSVDNPELLEFDILSASELGTYINGVMKKAKAKIAVGGYGEDRLVYRKSPHFGIGDEARSIHLGTDLWCEAHTKIAAPLDATIHSFKTNDNFGDYGPTIILQHQLEGTTFFTLYGHLSTGSLLNIGVGQFIAKGDFFAEIGEEHENGNWPPHLHFQVIADMQGKSGDFPGVASLREKAYYLELCPDPAHLLPLNKG